MQKIASRSQLWSKPNISHCWLHIRHTVSWLTLEHFRKQIQAFHPKICALLRPEILLFLDLTTEMRTKPYFSWFKKFKYSIFTGNPLLTSALLQYKRILEHGTNVKLAKKSGGDSSVVERRVSDQKVADSRFDSRTANASLCHWERQFTLISHLGPKQSPRCGGPGWRKTCKENPKICSALLRLDRRRVPGSYERTNEQRCFS